MSWLEECYLLKTCTYFKFPFRSWRIQIVFGFKNGLCLGGNCTFDLPTPWFTMQI